MPRKVDPGTIRSGSGLTTSTTTATEDRSELYKHSTSNPAHAAATISIVNAPDRYSSANVEGALDELAALVPPKPPALGSYSTFLSVTGIPDWGVLKLNDSKLDQRLGASVAPVDLAEAYGYWWAAGDPADTDPPFSVLGADPITDPVFNVGDGIYTGGGEAAAYAGAYTPNVGGPNPITQTLRVVASSGGVGAKPVVVSSTVYPADRGVLALLHWPARGSITDFLAQNLVDKCVAALVLGGGLVTACDGGLSGGIFSPGDDGSGGFDPFAYPGKASGQYSLAELHTGVSDVGGGPLPSPYDPGSANPAAGQVRLGSDLNAGVPLVAGGIPILGATTAATGGGDDNNFFRYRLPYLEDYSSTTGLKFTPSADKSRYFKKPTVSLDPGTDLTQAGNYDDLAKDFWSMQIARFRHRFTMDATVLGGSDPREDGSYILCHFKTEAAFEALVRDGVAPADSDLYSANLASWNYVGDASNVVEDTAGFPATSAYHLVRGSIFEDPGVIGPAGTKIFDYTAGTNGFMAVSGVWYFIPKASGGDTNFTFSDMSFTYTNFWVYSYRTTLPGQTGDAYIGNLNPGVMILSPFSYSEIAGVPTHDPGGIVSDVTYVKKQRSDLSFFELSGGNTAADGPLPADPLNFTFTGPSTWDILGDLEYPSFSQNAKPTMALYRPLGHDDASTLSVRTPLEPLDGQKVLFHSTRNVSPVYGNITTVGNGLTAAGTAVASVETAEKDVTERFLDEVYRYSKNSSTLDPVIDAQWEGPGLPNPPATIDLPVRSGTAAAPFHLNSWLQEGLHLIDVGSSGRELQVAGLPQRSPTFTVAEAVVNPFPSAGMVCYPQENYLSGYRPNFADDGQTQLDYTASTLDRDYVRAFDVAFSRSATPLSPEGQPFFTLRIRGVQLADFAYAAPGPGSLAAAVFIKVPGLTSWMDLGRVDGAGPSKQDPFADGAGCKVLGPETFDSFNVDDRVVYCEVKVNVGPAANLFKNTLNEVPILVKIRIKDSVQGRALTFDQTAFTEDSFNQRAFVGLEIVRP